MKIDHRNLTVRCNQCGVSAPSHGSIMDSALAATEEHGWHWRVVWIDPCCSRDDYFCPRCRVEFEEVDQ
jgi:hypothetical protein